MRISTGLAIGLGAAILFVANSGVKAQSPGDTISWTQYDYQCNYPTGQRIAVDNQGGVHLVWMSSYTYPSPRHSMYAYIDSTGEGHLYSLDPAGGAQIAVNSQNQPGIAYTTTTDLVYWTLGGQYIVSPDGYSPAVSIDHQDRIHIVYYTSGYVITYTSSEDGGQTWASPQVVEPTEMPAYMVTSSRVSDKTAIIFIRRDLSEQVWELIYIQSPDGQNWDWENGKMEFVPLEDSMYISGPDFDAVYDYNDDLHIVWNNQRELPGEIPDSVFMAHSNATTLQSDPISAWAYRLDPGDPGAWNSVVCKMSIGASMNGPLLVVTYTKFSQDDFSLGGYANGEIYRQYSLDGLTWSAPSNMTNSPSPGCAAGYCASDHWSSLAERVNDNMHLFYVYDRDAGGIPQTEGSITNNPMLYFRFPVDQLDIAEDGIAFPDGFSLSQNYPNPFNARTTIWYTLARESNIKIEIYDLLGQRIATLKEGRESMGSHAVVWDATHYSSGIYLCMFETETGSQSRRMLLIK